MLQWAGHRSAIDGCAESPTKCDDDAERSITATLQRPLVIVIASFEGTASCWQAKPWFRGRDALDVALRERHPPHQAASNRRS
jgi:hypothetical protein